MPELLKNIRRLRDIGLDWVQFAARFPARVKPSPDASSGRRPRSTPPDAPPVSEDQGVWASWGPQPPEALPPGIEQPSEVTRLAHKEARARADRTPPRLEPHRAQDHLGVACLQQAAQLLPGVPDDL